MADYMEMEDLTPILKSVYLPVRKKRIPSNDTAFGSGQEGDQKTRLPTQGMTSSSSLSWAVGLAL